MGTGWRWKFKSHFLQAVEMITQVHGSDPLTQSQAGIGIFQGSGLEGEEGVCGRTARDLGTWVLLTRRRQGPCQAFLSYKYSTW